MIENVSGPIALFSAIFTGMIVLGLIHARLSLRHPEIASGLGPIHRFDLNLRESCRHSGRWARMVFYAHFSIGDLLLSALCLICTALTVVILTYPLWVSHIEAMTYGLILGNR